MDERVTVITKIEISGSDPRGEVARFGAVIIVSSTLTYPTKSYNDSDVNVARGTEKYGGHYMIHIVGTRMTVPIVRAKVVNPCHLHVFGLMQMSVHLICSGNRNNTDMNLFGVWDSKLPL